MDDVIVLHNPRCSKSRAALALVEASGRKPRVVDYLAEPPTTAEIERLLALLDIGPRELMRTDEAIYRELGLADEALGHDALVAALHEHPRLLQRPIVLAGGKAVIGRPPERVLDIL